MRGEVGKWSVVRIDEARVFLHQLPERLDIAKLFDIGKRGVVFFVQACRQQGNDHVLRRATVKSAQHCHNVGVKLKRGLICPADSAKFRLALFVVKKLRV